MSSWLRRDSHTALRCRRVAASGEAASAEATASSSGAWEQVPALEGLLVKLVAAPRLAFEE